MVKFEIVLDKTDMIMLAEEQQVSRKFKGGQVIIDFEDENGRWKLSVDEVDMDGRDESR